MAKSNAYAGIGSRKTPGDILELMTDIGAFLAACGYTLRSGGAKGADTAFEVGADEYSGFKEIYLPWRRFNGNNSPLYHIGESALHMAKQYHPAWDRCSSMARNFHARNCYQVLGSMLDVPADFIICWTPGGAVTGGTGQALRLAQDKGIKILNLALPETRAYVKGIMQQHSKLIAS